MNFRMKYRYKNVIKDKIRNITKHIKILYNNAYQVSYERQTCLLFNKICNDLVIDNGIPAITSGKCRFLYMNADIYDNFKYFRYGYDNND